MRAGETKPVLLVIGRNLTIRYTCVIITTRSGLFFFSHSVRTMTSGTTIYIDRYIRIRISNILSFFTCCETSGRPTSRVQRGDVFWKKSDLVTSVFFNSIICFVGFLVFNAID